MKCAIVFDNKIVNLILVNEDSDIQKFAEVAGPGHTAELLSDAQSLTAWIGAIRIADGWSELVPVVPPAPTATELEAAAAAPHDLETVLEQQAKITSLESHVASLTTKVETLMAAVASLLAAE